ncbi:hypothetical protein BV22DRAFT_980859, partial [Leucogyrophana mollusca]
CVTGLLIRHVGERFQRSNSTISMYFRRMLKAFSLPSIYNRFVRLLSISDPVPSEILNERKIFPFFSDAIGAIDGTHIASAPPASERDALRNHK